MSRHEFSIRRGKAPASGCLDSSRDMQISQGSSPDMVSRAITSPDATNGQLATTYTQTAAQADSWKLT